MQLAPSTAALTFIAMAEGLLVTRRFGHEHGCTTNLNCNQLAFGAAGGSTVGPPTSPTPATKQAGSRTQRPIVNAAVGALLLVMFGTALLKQIPSPSIGAFVAIAVIPLLGISDFVRLWRERWFEFTTGAVCFLGVLLLGPIAGSRSCSHLSTSPSARPIRRSTCST